MSKRNFKPPMLPGTPKAPRTRAEINQEYSKLMAALGENRLTAKRLEAQSEAIFNRVAELEREVASLPPTKDEVPNAQQAG